MATLLQVLQRAFKDEKFWDQLLSDPKSALDSADFKLSQEDLIYLMKRIYNPAIVAAFERYRHKQPDPGIKKLGKVSETLTADTEFLDTGEEPKVPWS
jgi:hypothetical protein